MSTSYSLSQLHDVHTSINQEKNFSRSLLIRIEGRKTEGEGHLGHADDLMPSLSSYLFLQSLMVLQV